MGVSFNMLNNKVLENPLVQELHPSA